MDGADAVSYILQNNIQGDIVECGVGDGHFEHIWINELMKHDCIRHIYLYDTFAGLVKPSEHDYTCSNACIYQMNKDEVYHTWKRNVVNEKVNNWCYTPLEQVQNRLHETGYPEKNLHYVVGDVMETLKDTMTIPAKISILRLDTDWYESSKYELEQMYDNVVKGGVIIFDDYYHWNGQRKATDDFFSSKDIQYDFVNLGNQKTSAIIKI